MPKGLRWDSRAYRHEPVYSDLLNQIFGFHAPFHCCCCCWCCSRSRLPRWHLTCQKFTIVDLLGSYFLQIHVKFLCVMRYAPCSFHTLKNSLFHQNLARNSLHATGTSFVERAAFIHVATLSALNWLIFRELKPSWRRLCKTTTNLVAVVVIFFFLFLFEFFAIVRTTRLE